MSVPSTPTERPPHGRATGAWVVVAVLLGIGIVVPLLVPLYDSETPTLWGFPFFYWFQFALIPVVSVLTYIAFRISLSATRKDRQVFGLPPEPDADGGDRS
jgi:membrane protein implicated in regulation of membrane protease activity